MTAILLAVSTGLALVLLPTGAAVGAVSVSWKRVLGGLGRPVQVTSPLDGTGRLFVVLKGGRVRIVENGALRRGTYLDIGDRVKQGYDEGLLSIAFHPQWREHPVVWAAFINRRGNLQVSEFRASSATASYLAADTERPVLTVPMPATWPNHYGGQLAFGTDGMLYLSTGDGGGDADPANSAQDKDSRRGKLLRLQVVGASASCGRPYCVPRDNPFAGATQGDDLVWALGLRNPWRFSVDTGTGDLWIGDVGDHRREEVDRIPAGRGGANLGWSCREGDVVHTASRCSSGTRYLAPRFVYDGRVGHAVTGGFVYRGQRFRSLVGGQYVAGDFISGQVFRWSHAGGLFRMQARAS